MGKFGTLQILLKNVANIVRDHYQLYILTFEGVLVEDQRLV